MTTDVENSNVVISLDIRKDLRVLQFVDHDVIFEEGYRFVVCEILEMLCMTSSEQSQKILYYWQNRP